MHSPSSFPAHLPLVALNSAVLQSNDFDEDLDCIPWSGGQELVDVYRPARNRKHADFGHQWVGRKVQQL
jgi:hypothetical protein